MVVGTDTLHKPVRTRFVRRRVVVGGRNHDLVNVSSLIKDNDGTTFLLTVIEIFSKLAPCVPLKNKSSVSLLRALDDLFTADDDRPMTLQTNKGLEFLNRGVQ